MYKILLILILVPLSIFSQKKDSEYYFNLAEKQNRNGKMSKAYANYYEAARLSKNYIYYIKSAECYYLSHNNNKKKNKKRVESLYNKCFELKPWNNEGLLSRAQYEIYLSNYKEALRDIDSLLKRDTSNTEGYLLKAHIYLDKKDTLYAFKVYDLAIQKSPKSELGRIYIDKGSYCYNRGYWKESTESYYKALDLIGFDKFNPYFFCNLSSALFQIGDDNNACYFFKYCDIKKRPTLYDKEALMKLCK